MNDARAPIRVIVGVDTSKPDVTLVALSCGHVVCMNPVFKVKRLLRCAECGSLDKIRNLG